MEAIREACQAYLDFLESDEYHSDKIDDYENAIFEAAMEAIFGEKIWDRVNAAIDAGDE